RELRATCRGARQGLGVVGDVAAGHRPAVRVAHLCAVDRSSDLPPRVVVGAVAGRGTLGGHRGRGSHGRPAAGPPAHLGGGGPRDGSAVDLGFAGRADVVIPSGRGVVAGRGGRFVVGGVRGPDEGDRGHPPPGARRAVAHAGAVWVAVLRRGRNDLPPIGVPRRRADRIAADDHRGKAGRGWGTRDRRA